MKLRPLVFEFLKVLSIAVLYFVAIAIVIAASDDPQTEQFTVHASSEVQR